MKRLIEKKVFGIAISLTIFTHLVTNHSMAQSSIKKYVQENANAISTISPDSSEYSDFSSIATAIGDAKIVMLGEQDHGDAPTFLAKSRLIKFLHEKMGFDVLAFESDFFALNEGWDNLFKNDTSINSFLKRNIYPLWTYCNTTSWLLYDYINQTQKSKTPLEISGFDNQMYLAYSNKELLPKLDSFLKGLRIDITTTKEYQSEILPLIEASRRWYTPPADTSLFSKCNSYLQIIKKQVISKVGADNFWLLVIDNLIVENLEYQNSKTDYWMMQNLRDSQMAINLKWISEKKFPNKKIIVWAHNYHISKHSGHFFEDFMNKSMTMGSVFTKDPLAFNNTYVLGFTSGQGSTGRLFSGKTYKIESRKSNSFESWIDKSAKFSFVDFRRFNLSSYDTTQPFLLSGGIKGSAYHEPHKALWNKIFDGVFYIKDMYPCTQIKQQ